MAKLQELQEITGERAMPGINKMAKEEGIKDILDKFADRTTMHGPERLSSAKSLKANIFWSLVCLGSLGMLFYMLTTIIIQYMSFQVLVNVKEVRKPYLVVHVFANCVLRVHGKS